MVGASGPWIVVCIGIIGADIVVDRPVKKPDPRFTKTNDVRRRNMSAIRSKHTRPEIYVRSLLHRSGFRFRLHVRTLPGQPDIVLSKYQTAVFVHGCFWHGHACIRSHTPRTNTSYWLPKIARNRARFELTRSALRRLGWHVRTVHECRVDSDLRKLIDALRSTVNR